MDRFFERLKGFKFKHLPQEMQNEVLSFLSDKALLVFEKIAPSVFFSQEKMRRINSSARIKDLFLSEASLLAWLEKNGKNLISLNLSSIKKREHLLAALALCPNLESLNVSSCLISSDFLREIVSVLNPHKLKVLDLSNNQIEDEGSIELAKLTKLESLYAANNEIGPEGAAELLQFKSLKSLTLYGNHISQSMREEIKNLFPFTFLGEMGFF